MGGGRVAVRCETTYDLLPGDSFFLDNGNMHRYDLIRPAGFSWFGLKILDDSVGEDRFRGRCNISLFINIFL